MLNSPVVKVILDGQLLLNLHVNNLKEREPASAISVRLKVHSHRSSH